MTTEILYELRVLSGEQRGASSVIQPGQTLRIGQDWSNEVVLQQAEGTAMLSFSSTGTLLLQVRQGGGAVAETALESGSRAELGLYEPFTVGGIRLAVGQLGASQWAPLFASAPQGERAASAGPLESESALSGARDANPHVGTGQGASHVSGAATQSGPAATALAPAKSFCKAPLLVWSGKQNIAMATPSRHNVQRYRWRKESPRWTPISKPRWTAQPPGQSLWY